MFPDNEYYGHGSILRRHAGVSSWWQIPGRLQHGWNDKTGIDRSLMFGPWSKFLWSTRVHQACIAAGITGAHPVGAPLCYVVDSLRSIIRKKPVDERSLIVAPLHSAELADVAHGTPSAIRSIDELRRAGWDRITVMLYWIDAERPGVREAWASEGVRIVTNGRRDDPLFLQTMADNLAGHSALCSGRVSTIVFYAMYLGIPAFVHGHAGGLRGSSDPDGTKFSRWQRRVFPELMFERFDGTVHRGIAEAELGAEHVLSPSALRDTMAWSIRRLEFHARRRFQRWLFS